MFSLLEIQFHSLFNSSLCLYTILYSVHDNERNTNYAIQIGLSFLLRCQHRSNKLLVWISKAGNQPIQMENGFDFYRFYACHKITCESRRRILFKSTISILNQMIAPFYECIKRYSGQTLTSDKRKERKMINNICCKRWRMNGVGQCHFHILIAQYTHIFLCAIIYYLPLHALSLSHSLFIHPTLYLLVCPLLQWQIRNSIHIDSEKYFTKLHYIQWPYVLVEYTIHNLYHFDCFTVQNMHDL